MNITYCPPDPKAEQKAAVQRIADTHYYRLMKDGCDSRLAYYDTADVIKKIEKEIFKNE